MLVSPTDQRAEGGDTVGMIDRNTQRNALADIADYFRGCLGNADPDSAAARRFQIYIEAAESAAYSVPIKPLAEWLADYAVPPNVKMEKLDGMSAEEGLAQLVQGWEKLLMETEWGDADEAD